MSTTPLADPDTTLDAERVLVVWTAAWAGPCKTFDSITLTALRARHPRLRIHLVDIDEKVAAAKALEVRGVPWSMLYSATAPACAGKLDVDALTRNASDGYLGEFIGIRTTGAMEAFFASPSDPPTP